MTIPGPLDHICVNRFCVKSLTEGTNRLEVLSIKMSESSAGSTSSQKSFGSPLDPDGQKHLNRSFSFLTSKHKIDFCILKVESDQQHKGLRYEDWDKISRSHQGVVFPPTYFRRKLVW